MDENGEILLLHASKNKARPLVLPWFDDFADKQPYYHSHKVGVTFSSLIM